tara:strand:- start:246 stop:449 length:204 start_codon:yes stop_codon:yes gene_type:complete
MFLILRVKDAAPGRIWTCGPRLKRPLKMNHIGVLGSAPKLRRKLKALNIWVLPAMFEDVIVKSNKMI